MGADTFAKWRAVRSLMGRHPEGSASIDPSGAAGMDLDGAVAGFDSVRDRLVAETLAPPEKLQ